MRNISISLPVLCIVLVIFPHVVSGQQRFTGHVWREMPKPMKVTFLIGFTSGYQFGRQQGYASGAVQGIKWVESKVCKEEVEATCASVRKAAADKTGGIDALGLVLGGTTSFKEKTDYYTNELDAFYEAFPLCRGEDIFLILNKLVWIWAELVETSYNKVGAECGERSTK